MFNISDTDEAKLAALKYCPGYCDVERLEERVWHREGKFSVLGWDAFLYVHFRFCNMAKAGQV